MAKDLPYFKFDAAEWINGSITLESLEVQGLFINICAHYWFKSGSLSLSEIKRRLSAGLATAFDALIEAKIIGLEDDMIRIGFLDEQLAERRHLSEQNSANGRLGGRKKATALMSLSETKANQSNIEERREEKKREEDNFPSPQKAFEFITNNYHDTEGALKILANRGWRAAQKPQVEALLFHFLELHWATDKSQKDLRQHFKNWLNREGLDNLTKLSLTIATNHSERLKA